MWYILPILCGAAQILQAGANGALAARVGTPITAAFISFAIGTVLLGTSRRGRPFVGACSRNPCAVVGMDRRTSGRSLHQSTRRVGAADRCRYDRCACPGRTGLTRSNARPIRVGGLFAAPNDFAARRWPSPDRRRRRGLKGKLIDCLRWGRAGYRPPTRG